MSSADGGFLQEARGLHSLNNDRVDSDTKVTENQASAPRDMPRQAMRRFRSGAQRRQTGDERELEVSHTIKVVVFVVHHQNQLHLQFISFILVVCKSLWL